jgi:hypothetical protein
MDDLRDYLLSFDPADNKTFSEGLAAVIADSSGWWRDQWVEPDHWLGDYITHMDDEDGEDA